MNINQQTTIISAIGIPILILVLLVLASSTTNIGLCLDSCDFCLSYYSSYVERDGQCVISERILQSNTNMKQNGDKVIDVLEGADKEIFQQLKNGPQSIDEKHAKHIEELVLQNPNVANFVQGKNWTSICCGYSGNDGTYELTITFQDVETRKSMNITFDLDTLEITDIDSYQSVRFGVGLTDP